MTSKMQVLDRKKQAKSDQVGAAGNSRNTHRTEPLMLSQFLAVLKIL